MLSSLLPATTSAVSSAGLAVCCSKSSSASASDISSSPSEIQVLHGRLTIEGEVFVLRSVVRASLAGDDRLAARIRELLVVVKKALDEEAQYKLDRPTKEY